MYNNFRPTGSVIQLMDGRIFKRNQRNLWEDINTGVMVTEQQINLMVSSASFSSDASGGGRTNRKSSALAGIVVSLNAPFDDILASNSSEFQNTQRSVESSLGALTIRLNFSNGSYNGANGSLLVYKNATLIDTLDVSNRPTQDGTGLYVLSQTFDSGDSLQFGLLGGDGNILFDVTIEKTAPGGLLTMDTFEVRTSYAS